MHSPVAQGFSYFREALPLLLRPGLRLFVILPLLVNLLVFGGLIVFALQLFNDTLAHLMGSVPDWLSWLDWLLWPLFVVLMLLTVFFTFSLLANLIAAPFNGFLAEKIEVVLRGRDDFPPFSLQELASMVPRTVGRELRKLAYFLPRAIPLLLLTFGTIAGRHVYFRHFAVKMLSRFGIDKAALDPMYRGGAHVMEFRKW